MLRPRAQRGVTMIEVLITIVLLAFGLLGLAGLQTRMAAANTEAYQRAQALLLLEDMVDRLNANRNDAPSYETGTAAPLGTYDAQPATCDLVAAGVLRDQCEWSNALKGAAEKKGAANIGAMIGARGCVERVQAPNPTPGVCAPGIYRVTVTWQGLNATTAPALLCGQGSYGADAALQRVVSLKVVVALLRC
jgi:type IV pilus assembly protein PilV